MAAIREADIAQFGIESEASFLGAASGFLYDTKIVGFEWKTDYAQRSTKINLWRQETNQAFHGISHSGSIELEMQSSQGLLHILSSFFTRKSWTVGSSLDTYVFRPWKNDDPALPSLIFKITLGNPEAYWLKFTGVIIEKIRFQVRNQRISRVSVDWMAAALTETMSDPSWTYLDGSQGYLMTAEACDVTVGGLAATNLLEAGVEFRDPKGFQKMGRDGLFSQVSRKGHQTISGSLVDQYQYTLGMPPKARAGTETPVVINNAAQSAPSLYLKINLPRVVFQDADPVVIQSGPQIVNAPFKALIDDALDTDAEPEITLVTGIPTGGASSSAAPAPVNLAFEFDTTSWRQLTGAVISTHPTEYTLSVWVKRGVPGSNFNVFQRSNGTPSSAYTHCLRVTASAFEHYVYDGALKTLTGTTNPSASNWYHVAITAKNGGSMFLYVNGVSEGTPLGVGTLWTLGNDYWVAVKNNSTTTAMEGGLADLAFWTKELTPSEIAQLAAATGPGEPLLIQPGSLIFNFPMNDVGVGVSTSGDWIETVGNAITQTITGAEVGRVGPW